MATETGEEVKDLSVDKPVSSGLIWAGIICGILAVIFGLVAMVYVIYNTGPKGSVGEKGDKGEKGLTGTNGTNGSKGDAGSLTVSNPQIVLRYYESPSNGDTGDTVVYANHSTSLFKKTVTLTLPAAPDNIVPPILKINISFTYYVRKPTIAEAGSNPPGYNPLTHQTSKFNGLDTFVKIHNYGAEYLYLTIGEHSNDSPLVNASSIIKTGYYNMSLSVAGLPASFDVELRAYDPRVIKFEYTRLRIAVTS
jgi:hypothetical protein